MTDTGKTELERARATLTVEADDFGKSIRSVVTFPHDDQPVRRFISATEAFVNAIIDAREEIASASAGGGEPDGFDAFDPFGAPSPAQAPETREGYIAGQSSITINADEFDRLKEADLECEIHLAARRTAEASIRELEGHVDALAEGRIVTRSLQEARVERDRALEQGRIRHDLWRNAQSSLADIRERVLPKAKRLLALTDERPSKYDYVAVFELAEALVTLLTDPSPAARDTDTPAPALEYALWRGEKSRFGGYITGRGTTLDGRPFVVLENPDWHLSHWYPDDPKRLIRCDSPPAPAPDMKIGEPWPDPEDFPDPAPAPDVSGAVEALEAALTAKTWSVCLSYVHDARTALSSLRSADAKGGKSDG